MSGQPNLGGRPTLEQEADTKNTKSEVKVDLEMGKLTLKAVKHLTKMMNNVDTFKENTQLAIVFKILDKNKDYMKAKRAFEAESKIPKESDTQDDMDEDDLPCLDLSAPTTPATIN